VTIHGQHSQIPMRPPRPQPMALRSATTRLRRRPRDQRCPLEQLWPANITMIANKLRSFVGPGWRF
jgi:hypothetical protein